MMAGGHLVLVASDQRLADVIRFQLQKNTNQSAQVCSFDSVRLDPGEDGVLLLLVSGIENGKQAVDLIQQVSLLKGPATVLVDATGDSIPPESVVDVSAYVSKCVRWPHDAADLDRFVHRYLGRKRRLPSSDCYGLEERVSKHLLSQTPSLLPLVKHVALAAAHDVTVLLTGETGTGKTFLARLIHDCSPRKDQRFLVVPCGALAPTLVESELFGHAKGAFTGADWAKEGKFAAVGHGTLLLEEIDTLVLEQQATLLRVIETNEYEPVGSNETRTCAARTIVASNWNLEDAVARGKFRRDLYYRLNVMSFHLPPLRERVQDIEPLTRAMTARFNRKFHKRLFSISHPALAALKTFTWPGNIRQLENVIQQAVLVSHGPQLLLEHLPQPLREHACVHSGADPERHDSLLQNREILERTSIHRALVNSGYSRARAASALGVSRVTLYKKMKKYGLMDVPSQTPVSRSKA